MTDLKMLKVKIVLSGLSRTAIAAALGMSMPTFYNRLSGESEFRASEIRELTKVLKLSNAERDQIFFD